MAVNIGPFDVTFYGDGNSYDHFDDITYTGSKNWTEEEIADVSAMIQIWDGGIANAAGPRQIKLHLMWNEGDGYLGSSSSQFYGDYTTAVSYAEQLWRKHENIDNSYADVFILFDSTTMWNTGVDAPGANTYDFRSVVCHEIGHALGFATMYDPADDTWWNGGLTEWDKNLYDAASGGNKPSLGGVGMPGNFNQTAAPVYFDGTNAKAANGGNRVPIYAPVGFQDGSSLTHLDEDSFSNALLSPIIYNGQMIRQPTALEWQILKDFNWTLNTTTKTWTNGANNLQWSGVENWSISGVPDATQTVQFNNSFMLPNNNINLGGNYSVGSLAFDTTTNISIDGTTGTLTIATGDITRSAGSAGTHAITRPVVLGGNAIWDIAGSGSFSVSGAISGNYYLEKRGAGTLYLSGANTYAGATRVQNGALIISGGSTASTAFEVYAGKSLSFTDGNYSMGGVTFSNSGTININGGAVTFNSATSIPGTVNFSKGTIAGTGLLTFANPITWTNGTMSGAGTTKVNGVTFSGTGDPVLNGRTLNIAGTATFSSQLFLHGLNGAVVNILSGAMIDLQGYNSFQYDDVGSLPTLNNAGTFRKSVTDDTVYIQFVLNNTGVVDVQSGYVSFRAGVNQLSGTTLTGGTWKVKSYALLDFDLGGNITTNRANVTLDGPGSTFNEIISLASNQGSFSILGGRSFPIAANLANSGSLTVGAGSNLSITGDLSGAGTTTVSGQLTADSIVQNRLTIGSGGKVTIRPISGGMLSQDKIYAVPEPGTIVLLLVAVIALLLHKKR